MHLIQKFLRKGVELVEFTPDEIRDLVIEMVDNLEFNKKLNSEDEELQKTFKNLYASLNKPKQYYGDFKARDYHGQIISRFSTKFLRENKNWLR